MADIELSSGDEIRRRDNDEGTTLGKPTSAKIFRTFKPVDGHTDEDVIDELIETARQHGWEMELGERFNRGVKQTGDVDLRLSISINSDETGVFVSLQHA